MDFDAAVLPDDMSVVDLSTPDLNLPDLALAPVRLIAPLSTSTATSHHPTFRWTGGGQQAVLELCRDRGCTQMIDTLIGSNNRARPTTALERGVIFWRVRDGSEVSATWEVFVGARDSTLDNSYGTTLDVNGDGLADVGIGQLADGTSVGVAYVTLGNLAGISLATLTTLPCDELYPDWLGCWSVASAGDLDGDGFGDFVVSSIPNIAATNARPGIVHVYYGSASGIDPARTTLLRSPTIGGQFGRTIGGAGDVNGDGYGDLLVTAISSDSALHEWYVFYGGPAGVSFGLNQFLSVSNLSRNSGETSAVGDLNGDGYGDIVISDDLPALSKGRLLVYFGGPNGLSAPVGIASPGITQFGFYLTVADLDGDGYGDIVARGSSPSQIAYVFAGGSAGVSSVATSQISMAAGTWSLAFAGDADANGQDDLLMGGRTTASVFLSGMATFRTLNTGDNNLYSLAGVGDIDGDGNGELLSASVGEVSLFASTSANSEPVVNIQAPDGGATFGYSVAGLR